MTDITAVTHAQNIRYDKQAEALYIIDQTLLPGEEREIRLTTLDEMVEAIRALRVRGAPAIGICAGYCMYLLARDAWTEDRQAFLRKLTEDGEALNASRPTAVNLSWAIGEMMAVARARLQEPREALLDALYQKAVAIHEDDIAKCKAISEYGLSLLKEGDGVLTHCNAGPLATSRYGTAQGPSLLAAERGMHIRVFADETRPLLQGARLTAYELVRDHIPATLIADNMAASLMAKGKIDMVVVGCDRMAANGDFANKIGTYSVAVNAHHHGVPFYVALPCSTIDLTLPDGSGIPIEERDKDEVRTLYGVQTAPAQVDVYNPAFDVTPHSLVTGIITEKGVIYPPFKENLSKLFG